MKSLKQQSARLRKTIQNWTERILVQKWFDVGLRGKMSALVTIGLVGLITIFSYIALTIVHQSTRQLLNEHVLRARILAESLDSSINHIASTLTLLSAQLNVEDPQNSLEEWRVFFDQDILPVQGIYLLDEHYQMQAATENAPEINWAEALAKGMLDSGAERIVATEGIVRPYAIVAVPVMDLMNNTPSGTLAAILDLSNPAIFLSSGSLGLETKGTLQILDSQGKVLVSSHPDRMLTPNTIERITAQFVANDQPTFDACLGCATNGLETGTVIAIASLSQVQWGVIIWHDSQELFAPVRMIGLQAILLGLITIIGALLLVWLTTRSVIVPVQILTDATQRLCDVQFDPSTLKSIEGTLSSTLAKESWRRRDEIGILADSFIKMCTRLQLSINEIQTWNRELDARVQARTKQLSILNAVALTVNQSLNLDEILKRALDEVIQLTEIDVIAIFIQNPIRGNLELQAYRGLSKEAAQVAYQVGMLDGNCGGVMELGKAIIVQDVYAYRGRGARSLQRENINSIMHVPLMTKGWSLGSMCVGTHENAHVFNEEEQELLSAIGNQIAIAVENARLYADVQRKERLRSELFKKTLAAQEDERKRIARELHDEISQSLTALLYEAEDGLELKQGANIKKRLQSICELSQHTLDNVHKLMFDLRPSILDQLGLIPALRWLSETRLEPRGVHVRVVTNTNPDPLNNNNGSHNLSPEIETALFRVLQEAINNIARHAAARNVEIELLLQDSSATVSIKDDGIGFDMTELDTGSVKEIEGDGSVFSESTRGLGLLGMEERIQLLGGEMEIISAPGDGTCIHIRVPLEARSLVHD